MTFDTGALNSPDRAALLRARELFEQGLLIVREALGEPAAEAAPQATPLLDPDLIPLGVIAKRLEKSKDALRKWADRNGILVKIMGRLYVRESSLRALLNKST